MAVSALAPLADSMWDHMNDGWGVVMLISMVVFWVAVAAVVIWLVKRESSSAGHASEPRVTALDVLDRRFAEGAIDQTEYESRRKALLDRDP